MPRAYYNEIDKFAAAWLRELIYVGMLPAGDVDETDIQDVRPIDLVGYTQCHFFAGIGGWPYALRLAGWPDSRPVWTGSCPCQPFSTAGKGRGFADERHLWPAWFWHIGFNRPDVIFGEQVASPAGRAWLDLVSTDMEGERYAIAPIVLPAAGVGAPHIRQRLWFVADAEQEQRRRWAHEFRSAGADAAERIEKTIDDQRSRATGELADTNGAVAREGWLQRSGPELQSDRDAEARTPWSDVEWLECRDGKARPIEPGLEPLAHGIPARVGRLRGYGNAINPYVAAEVIQAYLDITA